LVTQLEPAPAAAAAAAAPDGTAAAAPAAAAGADGPKAGAEAGGAAHGQQQKSEDQQPRGGPVADLPEDQQALAWIQYMRYLRRHDVAASRRVRRVGGGLGEAGRREERAAPPCTSPLTLP
jgi:hypothetical protein